LLQKSRLRHGQTKVQSEQAENSLDKRSIMKALNVVPLGLDLLRSSQLNKTGDLSYGKAPASSSTATFIRLDVWPSSDLLNGSKLKQSGNWENNISKVNKKKIIKNSKNPLN